MGEALSNWRNDPQRVRPQGVGMACPLQDRENAEVLLDYVNRKLDVDNTLALERHMELCEPCRKFAHSQRAVWEALDAWEALPVSDDFDRRLRDRIEEEERSGFWARLWRRYFSAPAGLLAWQPAVAAAACLLLVAGVLFRTPNVPAPAPRTETVDIEQVERTLDDMEMLRQLQLSTPQKETPKPL
jgi:hypothetical protein